MQQGKGLRAMHGQTHFCHRDVAKWSNCAVMLIDCLGVYSTAALITTMLLRRNRNVIIPDSGIIRNPEG